MYKSTIEDADIIDIWGPIEYGEKLSKIIHTFTYSTQDFKKQLGLCFYHTASHTRYPHGIGVCYLAHCLIEICKRKFADKINITEDEINAVILFGLLHDLGHSAYGHASEIYLDGDHEDQTIKQLKDPENKIKQLIIENYNKNTLEKLIQLLKPESKNDSEFIRLIRKLLSGGIDIDRIDYIYRDGFSVLGEINDFSDILEYIDIEIINGRYEIVFEEKILPRIIEFYKKRFEFYDTIYFAKETCILEEIYGKFIKKTGEIADWKDTTIDMYILFNKYNQSKTKNPIVDKYIYNLQYTNLESSFIVKEVYSQIDFNLIMSNLRYLLPEIVADNELYSSCFSTTKRVVKMYNPQYRTLIKGKTIYDLLECKDFPSEEFKEKYIIGIDLTLLLFLLKNKGQNIDDIEKRIDLALSSPVLLGETVNSCEVSFSRER